MGILLTTPALIIVGCFMLYPLLRAVLLSFQEWQLAGANWIGWANYERLLSDRLFWLALGNTFFYAIWNLAAGTTLSLLIAVLMNRTGVWAQILRVAVFLPDILAISVSALAWIWLLDPDYGLMNRAMLEFGFITTPIPWLTSPANVKWAIVAVNIWLGTGLSSILLLAGLQSIPHDVHEAAAIDGATARQRFVRITLPLLRPVLLVVMTLKLIGSFKTFDQVFIMTGGGPLHRSDTILTYLYQQGFERFDFGYASAVGVIFFFIVAGLSAVQAVIARSRA